MAGLYIRNVKLPESAFDTRYLAVHQDGTVEYDGGPYGWQTTTATPAPDHGRLGDLDRILEIIDGIWDCNDMVFKPNDHCCDIPKDCHGCKWAETKRAIREIVANAPTIIPANRKEGET